MSASPDGGMGSEELWCSWYSELSLCADCLYDDGYAQRDCREGVNGVL